MQLCYTSTGFDLRMNAIDNDIQSNFSKCNDPIFYMDAMEAFISYGNPSPYTQHYFELDMSPYDVLFAASVYNPNGVCSGIQDTLLQCNETGYKNRVSLVIHSSLLTQRLVGSSTCRVL